MKNALYGLNETINVKITKKPFLVVNFHQDFDDAINKFVNIGLQPQDLITLMVNSCDDYSVKKVLRHVLKELLSIEVKKSVSLEELSKLTNEKKKPVAIITNAAVAQHLQDSHLYVNETLASFNEKSINTVYLCGKFNDINHYVDDNIKWDDNRIIFLFENFYNFKVSEKTLGNVRQVETINIETTTYLTTNKINAEIYSFTI